MSCIIIITEDMIDNENGVKELISYEGSEELSVIDCQKIIDLQPRIYALETCKSVTGSKKLTDSSLDNSFRRKTRGGVEQVQYNALSDLVHTVTLVPLSDRRDPEREVGYGITDSWDEIVKTLQGAPVSIDTELGGYMREFETRVRRDTNEIYSRLDDEQGERRLLAGRLNMLFRERRAHTYIRHLMETKARLFREAWVQSVDASDLARGKVMSLRTTVLGRTTEIRELHAADRRRQIVTSEMLRADHKRLKEM
nr:RNA-directed DNA polymerase, eukaryota [Tanacetum cinerariifolium]